MKRILSILLILVVLVLNSGLTIITHYCGGEAVESSYSLTHAELDCGMSLEDLQTCTDDPHNKHQSIQKKGCCENQYNSINDNFDFYKSQVNKSINYNFVIAFVHSIINNNSLLYKDKPSREVYLPPLINQDISVLHQVFII